LAYIRALITMPAAIAGPAKSASEKPMLVTGLASGLLLSGCCVGGAGGAEGLAVIVMLPRAEPCCSANQI
jgi:hypothetical protein